MAGAPSGNLLWRVIASHLTFVSFTTVFARIRKIIYQGFCASC